MPLPWPASEPRSLARRSRSQMRAPLRSPPRHHAPSPFLRPAVSFPRPRRRAAAAVLAACLVVGVGAGSVAASQAGGPLYGSRMWIEAATLPNDPMARANAQSGRLDARLREVRVASVSGDFVRCRGGTGRLCRDRGGSRRHRPPRTARSRPQSRTVWRSARSS